LALEQCPRGKAIVAGNAPASQGGIPVATGHAVRSGLPRDDALAGVTLNVARAFGVADAHGSLVPGEVANVVAWSGDPFETSTGVEHLFIRGRELPLVNRQTELRDRYKVLPARY
jgi:imidazolonepropionase-like amidohydrolase